MFPHSLGTVKTRRGRETHGTGAEICGAGLLRAGRRPGHHSGGVHGDGDPGVLPGHCPDRGYRGAAAAAGEASGGPAADHGRQRGADGAVYLGGERGFAEPVDGGAVFLPGGG